jgi:quercetin dioxygenase-like cupin family protein
VRPVSFDDAESYEPDEGWRRVSLAGSDQFSFEWFEKPPGHSSPLHDHENEQVCVCLQGELTVTVAHDPDHDHGDGEGAATESVTLHEHDSVLLESGEPHRVENTGDDRAVGLDVFAPGRSFDFWTDG